MTQQRSILAGAWGCRQRCFGSKQAGGPGTRVLTVQAVIAALNKADAALIHKQLSGVRGACKPRCWANQRLAAQGSLSLRLYSVGCSAAQYTARLGSSVPHLTRWLMYGRVCNRRPYVAHLVHLQANMGAAHDVHCVLRQQTCGTVGHTGVPRIAHLSPLGTGTRAPQAVHHVRRLAQGEGAGGPGSGAVRGRRRLGAQEQAQGGGVKRGLSREDVRL